MCLEEHESAQNYTIKLNLEPTNTRSSKLNKVYTQNPTLFQGKTIRDGNKPAHKLKFMVYFWLVTGL